MQVSFRLDANWYSDSYEMRLNKPRCADAYIFIVLSTVHIIMFLSSNGLTTMQNLFM